MLLPRVPELAWTANQLLTELMSKSVRPPDEMPALLGTVTVHDNSIQNTITVHRKMRVLFLAHNEDREDRTDALTGAELLLNDVRSTP